MRPEPGQVLHFSEDPTITRFVPHVAATARQPEAYVWAVDHGRSPDYWFPRQCPRVMAWTGPGTTAEDRDRIIGAGCGERVHAVEYGWLEAIRTTRVFAYRLPAASFEPFGAPVHHAHVAVEPVVPLGPAEPCEGHAAALMVVRARRRDGLARHLAERGVGTGVYYERPLHACGPYADAPRLGPLPVAERAARESLALPLFPGLDPVTVGRMAAAVEAFARAGGRLTRRARAGEGGRVAGDWQAMSGRHGLFSAPR